jgi:hypothetical protein
LLVAAEGISAARTNAIVVVVPIAVVLADLVLLPTSVPAVVVTVFIATLVLLPAFVFAIVVMLVAVAMVIAVLGRSSQGQRAS